MGFTGWLIPGMFSSSAVRSDETDEQAAGAGGSRCASDSLSQRQDWAISWHWTHHKPAALEIWGSTLQLCQCHSGPIMQRALFCSYPRRFARIEQVETRR
ncbi:hypothetical protein BR93DRAFT_932183 [Coniochaeta sp. PMI_546]|nr:hypothetical protein BR93DRAFT_932183 [Coniochaeta sp. PMI_546]